MGVRLSYFDEFIEHNGGRPRFQGLTARQVCELFIAAPCQATGQSICQQLRHKSPAVVGSATWFVSHTWDYPFLDTVEATRATLGRLLGEAEALNTVVWVDLFSLPQVETRADIPFEFLSTTFLGNVKAIGNVLMVMLPWDNPTTLTRAWCVFEAYACVHTGSRFEVAMTTAENDRFLKTIRRDHSIFYKMLAQINSSKSVATNPSDQQLIHRAIREEIDGGFTALDRTIFVELDNWMIRLLKRETDAAQDDVERTEWQAALGSIFQHSGQLDQAEPLYRECVAGRRRVLGDDNPNTFGSINSLAGLYRAQGRYSWSRWLPVVVCWAMTILKLSPWSTTWRVYMSRKAASSKLNLCTWSAWPPVVVCLATSILELSPRSTIWLGCTTRKAATAKLNHYSWSRWLPVVVCWAMTILKPLYHLQGRFEQAEPLYRECLASRRRVFGDEHPGTLSSINNLAGLYHLQGRYDQAEALLLESMTVSRRVLGDGHPGTLSSINNLAGLYHSQGRYDQAEPLFLESCTASRRVLGDDHPNTLSSINNLAAIYESQGRYEPAEPLYLECLAGRRHVLGDEHPETLTSIVNLAGLYRAQGNLAKARPLFNEYRRRTVQQ